LRGERQRGGEAAVEGRGKVREVEERSGGNGESNKRRWEKGRWRCIGKEKNILYSVFLAPALLLGTSKPVFA
jgi:hypothetical protein